MQSIQGYTFTDQIFESSRTIVLKAIRESDKSPVIVKVLNHQYPTSEELHRFEVEFEMTHSLQGDGIILAYDKELYGNSMALILEDFGGTSLNNIPNITKLPLTDKLELLILITEAINEVHQQNIFHKDINPGNILWNHKTQEVKLIDFGISSIIPKETRSITNPEVLEGTLNYISPEQTGRMNRSLDYRTDFYSLGVTFYEFLTGRLPYEADDAMKLVHAHIAKQAKPVHKIKNDIPKALSNIVEKLMAKNAEKRYQSAIGIIEDLKHCLGELKKSGKIEPFELARKDIVDHFQIPQKLYGREKEIERLLNTFDNICNGSKKLLMVAGHSGIGKSALISEIHKPITKNKGFFISGKFGQFNRNIPYFAFIRAFQDLVQQILTENEQRISQWRSNLLAGLKGNGRLITDVIPELELIIGPQPVLEELKPNAAQTRFSIVFRNFVKVFAKAEHPLVIFIDDLQWSDHSSLKLLMELLDDPKMQYLAIIGAYRDNEVSFTHSLTITLEEINKKIVDLETIVLQPLDLPKIILLIQDTLHCDYEPAHALAQLVFEKTNGNPFFINQFLQNLYDEDLLTYCQKSRQWQWDQQCISAMGITDNVVELMSNKITKLPQDTQHILQTAACIGPQFDLHYLSIIVELPLDRVASLLKVAAIEGLVISLTEFGFRESDIKVLSQEHTNKTPIKFKFLHDRVQQAAYSLIDKNQLDTIHFHIGELLLKNLNEEQLDEQIFDVVNQLNHGINLTEDANIRKVMASLNLKAGVKAKSALAYEPAMMYLKSGISLLENDSWQSDYSLTEDLYAEATETTYINASFEEMDKLAETMLFNIKSSFDKTIIYEYIVQSYFARNRAYEGIDIALKVLRQYKMKLPRNPSKLHVAYNILKTELYLFFKNRKQLSNLQPVQQGEATEKARLLDSLAVNCYTTLPNLYPIIVCKGFNLFFKYGLYPDTPFGYAAYGMLLSSALGKIDKGYEYGELALEVQQQPFCKKTRPRTIFLFESMLGYTKNHLLDGLERLMDSYRQGLEIGDIQFSTISIHIYCVHSFLAGEKPLHDLYKEAEIYKAEIVQYKQLVLANYQAIYMQAIKNLLGESENPKLLVGNIFNEHKAIPEFKEQSNSTGLYLIALNKLILCYMLGDYDEAASYLVVLEKYKSAVFGLYYTPFSYFFESLVLLAAFHSSDDSKKTARDRRAMLAKVRSNQRKLKKSADHAPMNFLHKYDLVEAEISRTKGQVGRALHYYNKSINGAKSNHYISEGALANELAGRFYLDMEEMHTVASYYLKEALYLYDKWGAKLKVDLLLENYKSFLTEPNKLENSFTSATTLTDFGRSTAITYRSSIATTDKSQHTFGHSLDLNSAIKASQVLSGEIVLSKLLNNMMNIVLENAGAEKGLVILDNEGTLTIEASADISTDNIHTLQQLPVSKSDSIPVNMIHYVARTKQVIIAKNACEEEQFKDDKYIADKKPKSVLCYPLLNQGELTGILYLENNLVEGAFTQQRLETLNLLSSNIAISIDNARLYSKLDNKNVQILHHLEATKEMSGAKTKIEAVDIALRHLLAMETDFNIKEVDLFIPSTDGKNFIGYKRWQNSNILETVIPYEVPERKSKFIAEINKLDVVDNQMLLPVLQEDRLKAVLGILSFDKHPKLSSETREMMEGMARSLALTIENIESQENSRLAGIGATAASIVHDLKNPIGAIMSFAEMAGKDDISINEKSEYLDIIHAEAARMSDMAHEVLEFSNGKINLSLTAIDSSLFLADIANFMKPIFEKSSISFSTQILQDGTLHIDKDRIRRVLLNLATNARDAIVSTPHKDAKFSLTIEHIDRGVHIIAADNGPGIPQQLHATLFEPFTTFGKSNGTGLGMSIVKMIVEAHGGTIVFDTAIGKGTRFNIFLPSHDQTELTENKAELTKAEDDNEVKPESHIQLNAKILIAEDNPVNQLLLKTLLKQSGCECYIAEDGHLAIEALQQQTFDIVLMDVEMPELDGYDTTHIIRNGRAETKDIPIIALTGHDTEESDTKCIESGMNAIVHKPIVTTDLYNAIAKHLKC